MTVLVFYIFCLFLRTNEESVRARKPLTEDHGFPLHEDVSCALVSIYNIALMILIARYVLILTAWLASIGTFALL